MSRSSSRLVLALVACCAMGVGTVAPAAAQVLPNLAPRSDFWIPNGLVETVAEADGVLYVGGTFDWVGPSSGPFAQVSRIGQATPAQLPTIQGSVWDVEPDGSGGWYVAGTFDRVGSVARDNFVHLMADGTVGPWDPLVNGTVRTLELDGTTLYLGGEFVSVMGQARNGLAALDVATSSLSPWDPGATFGGADFVNVVHVDGTVVHVGGLFSSATIGGAVRSNFATLDTTTGAATSLAPEPNDAVWDVERWGSHLVLAGNFTVVAGSPRSRIAAVDAVTGAPSSFRPDPDSTVLALAILGDQLYAGGLFQQFGGQTRHHLAAVDLATGTVLPWNPDVSGNDGASTSVEDLEIADGSLYVAGSFGSIGGQERRHVAEIDLATGLPSVWTAHLAGPTGPFARAIAVQGAQAGIGGNFEIGGGASRLGIAAFDLDGGTLLPWAPQVASSLSPLQEGTVREILIDGTRAYLAGVFSFVNGISRLHVAAIDLGSGAVDPTFVSALNPGSTYVSEMATDGTRLFLAGSFVFPGGSFVSLAAVDATTGQHLSAWMTNTSSRVEDLELSADGQTLYLAGTFVEVGDLVNGFHARNRLAALNAADGQVLPWNPDANGVARTLRLCGSTLFVGGDFLTVGADVRRYVAEVDTALGTATTWNTLVQGGGTTFVSAVEEYGGVLYLGGRFDQVNGLWYSHLAAVDRITGATLAWSPLPRSEILDLLVARNKLVVGGTFSALESESRSYLAVYDLAALATDVGSLSLSSGGTQNFTLRGGAELAGNHFILVGSMDGRLPGLALHDLFLPLNPDAYFLYTLLDPSLTPLAGSQGKLDSTGSAAASFVLPPGSTLFPAGITLNHAFFAYQLPAGFRFTSNAVPVKIVP